MRCYSVSYFDPHACLRKEATFAPHLKEIAPSMSLDRNEVRIFSIRHCTSTDLLNSERRFWSSPVDWGKENHDLDTRCPLGMLYYPVICPPANSGSSNV